MTTQNDEILTRLEDISRQLAAIDARQRFTEELIEEMTPIARLAMNSAAVRLADWEERGLFDMLAVTRGAVERVLDSYTKEDAEHLADAIVAILHTVRNVTQPGVLQVANQATDVLLQADGVKPVGMFGAMRKASRDEDIQRGLGVVLEVMRAVGRTQGAGTGTGTGTGTGLGTGTGTGTGTGAGLGTGTGTGTGTGAGPEAVRVAAPAPTREAPPAPTVTPDEVVHWEGYDFDASGFLVDPNTWTPELAQKVATGLGITLTDEHMHVIGWVRDDYASAGASPNVRRVANGSGVGTEAMYRLFPPTPGKTCAMISGVPKPVGCV